MKKPIHMAILRKVRPGCETAFESAVHAFFKASIPGSGTTAAQLITPLPGTSDTTYGILRSFASEADRDRFYASGAFSAWEASIKDLVEPEGYRREEFHGLEAFFGALHGPGQPPKWKMAVVTWLGVWPTVFIVGLLVSPHMPPMPKWAAVGIDTGLVVAALSWAVMPLLTKVFRPWLISGTGKKG